MNRLSLRQLPAGLLLGCLLFAAQASATVLFERLPATTATGIQADNSTGSPYTETVPLGAATIDQVTWWGYYDGGSPADDLFVLQLAGSTQSGRVTSIADGLVDGLTLYRYEMSLNTPYAFAGGSDLQIDLINDSLDVQWFWQGAGIVPGSNDTHVAVRLASNDVPEPGMLALLTAGLLSLAWFQRRRAAERRLARARLPIRNPVQR
ncbi:MAG TPA: PEP-CTERM sorting domain-containing protein [Accumulibacter sp.]|nr:PEP-CTERM sorting domain-containing protein [Accumulibacter sp.]